MSPKYEAVYSVDSQKMGDFQSAIVEAAGPQDAWVQLAVSHETSTPVRDVKLVKYREVQ